MKKTHSQVPAHSVNQPDTLFVDSTKLELVFKTKSGSLKSKSLEVDYYRVLNSYVSVKRILASKPILLHMEHAQLQTLFDLQEMENLYVLAFNEEKEFIGGSLLGQKALAPFQLLSQSKFSLVLYRQIEIDFGKLLQLKIPNVFPKPRELSALSDFELLETFNKECGHNGWTSSRGEFLGKLVYEMKRRNWDLSQLVSGNERISFSSKNKSRLVNNQLIPLSK